jgi:hypothetical protein
LSGIATARPVASVSANALAKRGARIVAERPVNTLRRLRFARDFTVDPFVVGTVLALTLSRFHVTGDWNI